jgi:UDP-N-acetylmuramoyl-tripeptide--D-alanyl-D-alanine ligase
LRTSSSIDLTLCVDSEQQKTKFGSSQHGWVHLNAQQALLTDNICAAAAVALALKVPAQSIEQSLQNFQGAQGRMQVLLRSPRLELIDDSFNASPKSCQRALAYLHQHQAKRKIFVFGDMKSLAERSDYWHRQVAQWLMATDVDYVITLGEAAKMTHDSYQGRKHHAQDFAEVLTVLAGLYDGQKSLIVLKASHAMRFSLLGQAIVAYDHGYESKVATKGEVF